GYNITFEVTGSWTLELSLNGSVVVNAPITITASSVVNRPPVDVTASFDPPIPYASQAIFCRVPFHLIDDVDYNVVRYRYLWKRNGVTVRESTNASLADAIPWKLTPNPALDPRITSVVETSTNLANWVPASFNSATNTWSAGNVSERRRFMRLRISFP
ncbi:MAG: hypothetical protein ABR589_13540, partial [Chthoniobacterales bacterium]